MINVICSKVRKSHRYFLVSSKMADSAAQSNVAWHLPYWPIFANKSTLQLSWSVHGTVVCMVLGCLGWLWSSGYKNVRFTWDQKIKLGKSCQLMKGHQSTRKGREQGRSSGERQSLKCPSLLDQPKLFWVFLFLFYSFFSSRWYSFAMQSSLVQKHTCVLLSLSDVLYGKTTSAKKILIHVHPMKQFHAFISLMFLQLGPAFAVILFSEGSL